MGYFIKMIKFWEKSLLVQIIGSFSVLSFSTIFCVSCVAFVQAKASLKQSVFERLTTVASLREGELRRWLKDRRNTLLSLNHISDIKLATQELLTTDKSSSAYNESLETLKTSFDNFISNRSDYREIFLLSRGSRVLMSTKSENIGRYLPRDQSSEMVQESDSTTFISNFYQSPDTLLPTVTLSTPILDEQGNRLGTLSAHLNLDRIDEITGDIQGMGETGENYLVTDIGSNFKTRHVFASARQFEADEFPEGINSPGIIAAMNGGRGRGLYLNYRNVPVIGVYRWIEAQNVALLVEIEQAEAFKLANQLARSILLIGLILAVIMTVAIWLLGRQIVTPILQISQTARLSGRNIQSGKLSELEFVSISAENEIGVLAEAFNQMTQHVSNSHEKLEDKNQALKTALSKLKKTQLQMIQTEKMAALGQMVAGLAHEVNNPVSFIYGNLGYVEEYTEALLELTELYAVEYPCETPGIATEKENIELDFLKADLPKVLASIRLGTERIQGIVKSMRNFSRLDEAERKVADLQEGIEGTLLILQHRLKAQSNRPAIDIIKDYGELPLIECYPGQLNQVFLNLIGNAIDAMESALLDGHIDHAILRIHTGIESGKAVVRIADNGSGIPKEIYQKIFDPFFTTKPVGKGTGLGLSISYAIVVDHHHGELTCQSTMGKGTEFIIVIPA